MVVGHHRIQLVWINCLLILSHPLIGKNFKKNHANKTSPVSATAPVDFTSLRQTHFIIYESIAWLLQNLLSVDQTIIETIKHVDYQYHKPISPFYRRNVADCRFNFCINIKPATIVSVNGNNVAPYESKL
jgi:hypothetical protein